MPRTRYRVVDNQYPHFMTSSIVAWLPVFSDPDCAEIVLDSWRFLQRERDIKILSWVIMENHIHWIAVGPLLSRRVGEFKSFTATSIVRRLENKGRATLLQELKFFKLKHKTDQIHQIWQEGSHPQVLESDDILWQKINYIHNNPIRRGYVDDPAHWRYSSARAYVGLPCLLGTHTEWV